MPRDASLRCRFRPVGLGPSPDRGCAAAGVGAACLRCPVFDGPTAVASEGLVGRCNPPAVGDETACELPQLRLRDAPGAAPPSGWPAPAPPECLLPCDDALPFPTPLQYGQMNLSASNCLGV